MVYSNLDVISTCRTAMTVRACARLLRLYFMVCLPYESIKVNDFCISLIRIYTPSQNHHSVFRDVSKRVVLVQAYMPDHLMVFFWMVLWIIITKVDVYWVPIDTEKVLRNPVLTTIELYVHGFGAPLIDGIISNTYFSGVIGLYRRWFTLGISHLFQCCSYNLRLFHVNK